MSAKEVKGQPEWLNVSWNFPSSWPLRDAFPLEFHIRYRPYGSMYWSEVSELSVHQQIRGQMDVRGVLQ